ncbi:hypothetical protein [Streptomyces sp. NPDC004546]|uniref:hypothetical protein n=1 Tax=Streptomyces sp. NPDC004546 TaxID=3154282 RepID=UPI0033A76DBA
MPHPRTRYYGTHILTPRDYSPTGFVGAAFKETVTGQGDYVTGYVTGCEADLMVGRAVAKGRTIRVYEYGALSISSLPRGASTHDLVTKQSLTLDIVIHPKKMTDRQYEDLRIIDQYERRARAELDGQGRTVAITAGFLRIPLVQTSILLSRGWISQSPHSDRIWISSAGRMALAWRWRAERALSSRLMKGLYLDAAMTAADTARAITAERARAHTA